jgi:sulfur-oxidizing protein SoxZ
MAARALINVPPKAKRGEVIGIKSLISHEMETGFRPNAMGQLIPRNIIKEFVCTYNGVEVFRAEFFPAMSANPFVSFTTVAGRHHHDLELRQRPSPPGPSPSPSNDPCGRVPRRSHCHGGSTLPAGRTSPRPSEVRLRLHGA